MTQVVLMNLNTAYKNLLNIYKYVNYLLINAALALTSPMNKRHIKLINLLIEQSITLLLHRKYRNNKVIKERKKRVSLSAIAKDSRINGGGS